jgi:hypothetical protein
MQCRVLWLTLLLHCFQADGNDDPLSMNENSAWSKFHEEEELRKEIKKDLERLYPTGCDEFFIQPEINAVMMNILFVWSRMHEDTSYRQGMHELLAPIIFLLDREKNTVGATPPPNPELMDAINPQWLEQDAFWMFDHMMKYGSILLVRQGTAKEG